MTLFSLSSALCLWCVHPSFPLSFSLFSYLSLVSWCSNFSPGNSLSCSTFSFLLSIRFPLSIWHFHISIQRVYVNFLGEKLSCSTITYLQGGGGGGVFRRIWNARNESKNLPAINKMQKTWPTTWGPPAVASLRRLPLAARTAGLPLSVLPFAICKRGRGGKKLNNLIRNSHCASHWTTKASQIGCQAKWQRSSRRGKE